MRGVIISTSNGGYCFVGEEVIYKSAIPAADVQTLARISSEQKFPCIFVGEHDICVCQPDDMVKKIFNDYLKVDVLPVAIKIRMPLALAAAMASMVVWGIAWVLKLTKVPSMSKNRALII